MSNGDKKSPVGTLAVLGLCGVACAAPLLLAGGGGAAIAGYLGGNLWTVLAGVGIVALGTFFMMNRGENEPIEGRNDNSLP